MSKSKMSSRTLGTPIRPVTEDGLEFHTVRDYDNYLQDNGLVDLDVRRSCRARTGVRKYRYNKETKKVEEVI